MMEVIPVLDLKSGIAVSGQSGKRHTYTPLKTVYSTSSDPVMISNSLRHNGARRIYVADLDMIEKKGSNLDVAQKINLFLPVILDCGVRNLETFKFALKFAYKIIVATETLESVEELDKICEKFPASRLVVSVDVKKGKLYAPNLDLSLEEFKDKLIKLNLPEIILLDISQVGTYKGFNKDLIEKFIDLKTSLILGGGITPEDKEKLNTQGIKKVLIGSALHNGQINL